jgi:hypothetical protein
VSFLLYQHHLSALRCMDCVSLDNSQQRAVAAQASSSKLAHWFDGERRSLEERLETLQDPKYLDARGRALNKRNVAAVKLQSVLRGFMARKRFFHQLELEANLLSYEVSMEARLRWRKVAQAVADARPVRYMLRQLYAKIGAEAKLGAPASSAANGPSSTSGIVIISNPEERMESLCKSAVRLIVEQSR